MSATVQIKPKRVLSTLEEDGSRRWLTPRLAIGKLYRQRRIVAYALIALLTALPLISINGRPAVLLNIPDRQFTLLGYTFLPTDTVLLALLLVSWFATIFLCTALVGRTWCGWTCPQTVYMEFVYRPIERLCLGKKGVGGKPRADLPGWRYAVMHVIFVSISLIITHTLLSYLVGIDQLRQWVTSSPAQHPWAFGVIFISTFAVWFNFVHFREQMCIIACPYGRFQSVLFDPQSLNVRYNDGRGEPRMKMNDRVRKAISLPRADAPPANCGGDKTACSTCGKFCPDSAATKAFTPVTASAGDCIDCSMCVQVCPTGIDIRDGVQLECINCTQCIDACDAVMAKVGKPGRLIGFYSQAELTQQPKRILRPRVMLYGAVSGGFLGLMLILILIKSPFDAALQRNVGLPFLTTAQGQIENTMRLTLRNRSHRPQTFTIESRTPGITLAGDTQSFTVPAGTSVMHPLNLLADPSAVPGGMATASLAIRNNDQVEKTVQYQLFGPGGR